MRRVLLFNTDLEIGGTPTVVRELAVRLRKASGQVVDVACLARWGPVADQLAAAGVPVTALGARSIRDFPGAVRRLAALFRSGQEQPPRPYDTVFSFLAHANTVAASASLRCRGVRFLQSIQTTQPYPRWHWTVQRLAQHAAERIVVPSDSVAQAARQWAKVPPEKIDVIYNAIDLEEFTPVAPAPVDPRPFPIGFIGRLDPVKRLPDLLAAVKRLGREVHLHVFGDGPQRSTIEAEIARLEIGSSVTMHGFVPKESALRRIGLLVLPSQAEGFPMVVIEAQAAGVPVVGTDVPGIRDAIVHEQTGLLVRSGDPSTLAAAIRRLMEDWDFRASLIEQARRRVAERFSWPVILDQYRRLLEM